MNQLCLFDADIRCEEEIFTPNNHEGFLKEFKFITL